MTGESGGVKSCLNLHETYEAQVTRPLYRFDTCMLFGKMLALS